MPGIQPNAACAITHVVMTSTLILWMRKLRLRKVNYPLKVMQRQHLEQGRRGDWDSLWLEECVRDA